MREATRVRRVQYPIEGSLRLCPPRWFLFLVGWFPVGVLGDPHKPEIDDVHLWPPTLTSSGSHKTRGTWHIKNTFKLSNLPTSNQSRNNCTTPSAGLQWYDTTVILQRIGSTSCPAVQIQLYASLVGYTHVIVTLTA